MRRIVLIFALLLPVSLIAQELKTADSAIVIVLSPRVGAEINAEEAATYHLFRQLPGFLWGEFFLVNGEAFVLHAVMVDRSGVQRDTLVPFPDQLLYLLAEKINHLEEIESGTYHPSGDAVKFPTIVVSRPNTVIRNAARSSRAADSLHAVLPERSTVPTYPAAVSLMPDVLPFANGSAEDARRQIEYPNFGFGLGYGPYSINVDGAARAFEAALIPYLPQSAPGTPPDDDSRTGPMLWGHILVRVSPRISVRGEVGYAQGPKDFTYSVVLGDVEYNFLPLSLVRPYVGIGLGNYHFEMIRRYGWIVSTDQVNGYTTLDEITLRGSQFGFVMKCGVEIFPMQMPGVDLSAGYSVVPPIDITSTDVVLSSIKISGFTFVIRFTITL